MATSFGHDFVTLSGRNEYQDRVAVGELMGEPTWFGRFAIPIPAMVKVEARVGVQ